ncbi:MAG: hypothetical protein Q8P51_07410 [Ignavibacteria bacterium]|nr:hypothetical protein [Ignavibacteria bacterium]
MQLTSRKSKILDHELAVRRNVAYQLMGGKLTSHMKRQKNNISIYFTDSKGGEYFLLQLLNIGTKTDELKFIFNDPATNTNGTYNETTGVLGDNDLIHPRPEISYHYDGTMLWKMPANKSQSRAIHKNPLGAGRKRTPLPQITTWEPIIRYRVYDYSLCKKDRSTSPVVLPSKPKLFDGTPFECQIYLGSKDSPSVTNDEVTLSLRVSDFAESVDLLFVMWKSQLKGQFLKLGNSGEQVWSTNNLIEIIELVQ